MSNKLTRTAANVWEGLRQILGDDAYKRYLEHLRRHHPGTEPLDRTEFYKTDVERRWSGINRCC